MELSNQEVGGDVRMRGEERQNPYILPCSSWCEYAGPYCWERPECPLRREFEESEEDEEDEEDDELIPVAVDDDWR